MAVNRRLNAARRLVLVATILTFSFALMTQAQGVMLERLRLPENFSVQIYADNVPNARQMALGDDGTLYVGSRSEGSVYAVRDNDGDDVADEVVVIASGLYMPSGVAFRHGTLYVAEVHRVHAFERIAENYANSPQSEIVYSALPDDAHHGWKFIAFGPDDKLYIPVGAPCNVCDVSDPHGTILRVDLEANAAEIVARGVRNSVGFDWHPKTRDLWFSDNGRDWLGDDLPPGEINRVTQVGQHFGFPYRHGADLNDPEFGDGKDRQDFVAPIVELPAHVAPLGIMFYHGTAFPDAFQGSLFVAEHGSWNRTRKSGYEVVRVVFNEDGTVRETKPFITGWKLGEAHWGRPVDFLMLPDGSLLISDDHAGVIYRVTYQGPPS